MARAATQEAEEETEKPVAAAGGMPSGKLMLIGVLVLVLLLTISVGLAAFFALRGSASHQESAADGDSASAEASSEEHVAPKGKEKGKEKAKDEKKEKEKKLPPQYLDMSPAFVVNLQDDQAMRYLQIEIQVMTRDLKAAEEIKANIPRLRNTLMMLFAQQHAKDLITREAKEALQQQALEQVQAVMKEETGSPGIEAVYFTNFVIQ